MLIFKSQESSIQSDDFMLNLIYKAIEVFRHLGYSIVQGISSSGSLISYFSNGGFGGLLGSVSSFFTALSS